MEPVPIRKNRISCAAEDPAIVSKPQATTIAAMRCHRLYRLRAITPSGPLIAVILRSISASRSALGPADFLFPLLVTLFAEFELFGSRLKAGMQAFLLDPIALFALAAEHNHRHCAADNGLANSVFHLTA